jgi:integrase
MLRHFGLYEKFRSKVKSLDEGESSGRVPALEEEMALLTETSRAGEKQGNWSPVYTVTVLGLNTGMRHSEIRGLKWKPIDLKARVLRVGKSKTEAGAGRFIRLTQSACAALDMWASKFANRKPEEYTFPAFENGNIDPSKPVSN